jgi:PAS domain S-box-containing protein
LSDQIDQRVETAEDSALAAIVRSSHDAVISKTVTGIVTSWNEGATLVYGHPAGEMVGRSIERTIPRRFLDEERLRHARVARGSAETGYRCTRLHRDGHQLELVMSMSPVRAASGEVVGVASISRPVSEHERAEARYAALLEAAPDAMVGVRPDGTISVVNAQAGVMFGWTTGELIGRSLETLVSGLLQDLPDGDHNGRPRRARGRPLGLETSASGRRRDGSTFPVEVSLAATRDADGDLLVMAAIRDVTNLRAVQASLLESEARLRQLADNVGSVFTLRQIDPPANLYVSRALEKLSGYSAAEAMDDPGFMTSKVVHPDDLSRVLEELGGPPGEGRSAVSEHRILRRDGEVRWVRSVAAPVPPDGDGPVERVVGTMEDTTAQVVATRALAAAEAEARSANEAKNEFLSRMSHELRTPLNAVLGFSQLLELGLTDPQHLESVQHILRAGRHLLALINDVLDIAKIEAGEITISLESLSMSSVVSEVATLMRPIADAAGVTLVLGDADTSSFVLADHQRLRQILLNLVSNAVKYNARGGHVWLGWQTTDQVTRIVVRDDGPGIPMRLQDRLFVPFDRLGAEATAVDGSGVGLAVSRGLVELMGGTVECVSEEGEGAAFSVILPIASEPDDAPSPEAPPASPPDECGPRRTLLYVEDNMANVKIMQAIAGLRPGWTFLHAALGQLGVELARAHQPDLVLLDLHLPDVPGKDVLAELRADSRTASLPVAIVSADASLRQREHLLACGAAKYLTKPLDLPEVLGLLDEIQAGPRRLVR